MSTQQASIKIWVSPDGNDRAAGTRNEPVKSLDQAVRLVRRKRRGQNGNRGANLLLRGGTHTLLRPLVLDARDSTVGVNAGNDRPGSIVEPLVICSAPGERAVISGGRPITGWREAGWEQLGEGY